MSTTSRFPGGIDVPHVVAEAALSGSIPRGLATTTAATIAMNSAPAPAPSPSAPSHPDPMLLDLYMALLLPRMIEEKMLLLLRQGAVSKWFSGIGQEAIAVGATMALRSDDYILPLHRN